MTFGVIATIMANPGSRGELVRLASALSFASLRNESGGCTRFDVLLDEVDEDKLHLVAGFTDVRAHLRHENSAHFATWRERSAPLVASKDRVSVKPVPTGASSDEASSQAGPFQLDSHRIGSLAVLVQLDVIDGAVESFSAAISANARASLRGRYGCRVFDVFRNLETVNRFHLYELYENASAFDVDHRETAHFAAWKQAATRHVVPGSQCVVRSTLT